MGLKLVIKDLAAQKLKKTGIKCVECCFWFDFKKKNLLEELYNIRSLADARLLFRRRLKNPGYDRSGQKKLIAFVEKGGIVKGAYKDKKCIGLLTAGSYELFPELQSFRVFPPDPQSTFLGCIYVRPEEKGQGIKKRLLVELEKDLLRKNVTSIEAVGKRLDDDVDEEEFENSPLLSFKFLINNGFHLKKNDEYYPLLRLDLGSIAREPALEKVSVTEAAYKKTVRNPVVIREK